MKKPKIPQMRKKQIRRLTRRILPQLLIQSIGITVTALVSFFIMTWLISDLLEVQHIYAAAGFEMLGTLGILILVIVPLNTYFYRKRATEVVTLSDAIQSVAGGNYASRIPTDKRTSITPIYEDFNKMCDELQGIQILRNDFINNYSHEFKTPIASINGFAELLLEKELSENERRQYLQIIADESARLSKFASDTGLLSKFSSLSIVTDIETYDLSEQLRECSILLSPKWMGKDIELTGDFEEVKYTGNKEMMQHMWINLLDNAVKYTQEGGVIKINVKNELSHIKVSIEDNGEGISEEVQKYLFTPYFQGETSHSRHGLGLGLSIVKRITELCNGTIMVKSELGKGSVFTVRLPK